MVARVRDPIDGRGGGQAPMHQVKSACCKPPSPRTRRTKEARVRARPSRGVGRKEDNIPPPTPSEVMPRYDSPIAHVRGCPSTNPLTKQSKHMYMYLLTKLSASQPATQHVCFIIPHTVYIYHKHNFKERHVGPLLKSGKIRQHVACRTLKTA
jgi:hypothetical protein